MTPTATGRTITCLTGFAVTLIIGVAIVLQLEHADLVPERVDARVLPTSPEHEIQIQRGAVLSGTVVDADGHPVKRVTVFLRGEAAIGRVATRTDANGIFHFRRLKAGSYTLSAGWGRNRAKSRIELETGAEKHVTLNLNFNLSRW